MQFTVTELFTRPTVDEPLEWTGNLPVRAARALAEAGYDARLLLDADAERRAVAPRPRVVTGLGRPPGVTANRHREP